jgi:hypothetical protein
VCHSTIFVVKVRHLKKYLAHCAAHENFRLCAFVIFEWQAKKRAKPNPRVFDCECATLNFFDFLRSKMAFNQKVFIKMVEKALKIYRKQRMMTWNYILHHSTITTW